jgi:Domain of unknown function (DUF4129)
VTRFYDGLVAWLFDLLSPQLTLLILLALTGLVAALWYWYPAWVPRRMPRLRFTLPRLRLPRWRFPRVRLNWRLPRWRRKPRAKPRPKAQPVPEAVEPDAVEPRPSGNGLSLADRLAAEGRFAEAIRERLRDTVSDLTRAGVIKPEPGTTALELTADAAARRPAVGAPLDGATAIFSEIWYGRREASPGHDARMRTLTAEVRSSLTGPPGGVE